VTEADRAAARVSAAQIRAALLDPEQAGKRIVALVTMARPRRAVRITTWSGLAGVTRWGADFMHDLLPGWACTPAEFKTEMLDDLDRLAETGERPTAPSR
jgi:hypothetical protein